MAGRGGVPVVAVVVVKGGGNVRDGGGVSGGKLVRTGGGNVTSGAPKLSEDFYGKFRESSCKEGENTLLGSIVNVGLCLGSGICISGSEMNGSDEKLSPWRSFSGLLSFEGKATCLGK